MSYIKKLLITSVLITALYPSLISAMYAPVDYKIQLNLQKALDAHDFEKAKICLEQGADLNLFYLRLGVPTDPRSEITLLQHYAQDGTVEQVAFLLEHGADPFCYNHFGHNALCLSIYNKLPGQAQKIIPLLAKRVGVNCPISEQPEYMALHAVAQDQNVPFIELLLQLGADPNSESGCFNEVWWQHTPLDKVLSLSPESRLKPTFFPTIKLLYQYGACTHREALQDYLTPEEIVELEQAREQVLAFRDCRYLKQSYPYPGGDQLGEGWVPYKDLYDSELLKYLTQLPKPVAKICADYSDNALFGALLDPEYMGEVGEQAGVQMEDEEKE